MSGRFVYDQRLDLGALRVLLASPSGAVMRNMLRRGLLVETQAKRNLAGANGKPKRIDTGRLRSSLTTQVVQDGAGPRVTIGTNVRYARWVHDGTGFYGPLHRPIRPKRGRLLRFKPRGFRVPYRHTKGGWVYAREVQGMRPNQFLRDALSAARG